MTGDGPARTARRLLMLATAAMPPSRREWGRAISAELACAHSRGEQARLILTAVRIALLPPPGAALYGRAARRSAALAAIAYLPLGLGLYLANVVFPATRDSTAGVLAMDAYLIGTLMAAGALARRSSAKPGTPIIAGMAAGLVLAVLGMATLAVTGSAFNDRLEATAPGVTVLLTIAGAAIAPLGAALAQQATITRSHLRHIAKR